MGARDLDKREFLMLAGTFEPDKHDPTGWYMSEKLDGMRCFWDGGISQGLNAKVVPYANSSKGGNDQICTGLWSRGGKIVHAPAWFIDDLPKGVLLDGELWARGVALQDIISITRAYDKDVEWSKLDYMVFDSPSHPQFFRAGRVHISDWEAHLPDMKAWAITMGLKWSDETPAFRKTLETLDGWEGAHWSLLPQKICKSPEDMVKFLDKIVAKDGEGVMLRAPNSVWNPRRDRYGLLKVKKFYDAEAEIIGFVFGNETNKDSRLRGLIGGLKVRELETGHVFELPGLNDSERKIHGKNPDGCLGSSLQDAEKYAWDNPGGEAPDWVKSDTFKRGQKITFKYWDRTKDGVPKFAQYHRVKEDE